MNRRRKRVIAIMLPSRVRNDLKVVPYMVGSTPRLFRVTLSLSSALPWHHRRHADNVGVDLQIHPKRGQIGQAIDERVEAILFSYRKED